MCDLNDGFKLCSCEDVETLKKEEICWELKRINPEKTLYHKRGRAAVPHFSSKDNEVIEKIVKELNYRNCFDFDFEAQENDYLRLKVNIDNKEKWFAFRFMDKEWNLDKSTSLASWKTQLIAFKDGKLK